MQSANRVYPWFQTTLVLVLCSLAGCSIHPIQMVVVNGKSLQRRADMSLISNNDERHCMQDINNGNWNHGGQIAEHVRRPSPWRAKYHPSYSKNRWMAVNGRLGNGRTYPAVLDTGASAALVVNDIHILENKLAIRPFGPGSSNSAGWGICHVPELRMGEVTLVNWPCFYREQHMEIRLFGLPISKDRAIIVGLPALQRFEYVAFDSARKEVEFSLNDVFKPSQFDLWTKCPFVIEEDFAGNALLFVTIPIAGMETKLQLDTGSGRGLAISAELWDRMRKNIRQIELTDGKDLYPYIGWLPCRRGVIPELCVGSRIVRRALISVFPNGSPLLDQCQGLLGMQYFQDTVMVLDFERNLMWVRNPQNRRPCPASL